MWDPQPAEGGNKSRSREAHTHGASRSDENAKRVIFAAFACAKRWLWDRTPHHHHDLTQPISIIYSANYAYDNKVICTFFRPMHAHCILTIPNRAGALENLESCAKSAVLQEFVIRGVSRRLLFKEYVPINIQ